MHGEGFFFQAFVYLTAAVVSVPIAKRLGLGSVLGHLFPVWLRFKGGKGVATALGVLLALHFLVGVAACLSWLAVAAVPYGFLSGASFGVGMILGPFLLGAGVVGETLIATVAVMGFLLNLIKTVAFGLSPLLTPAYMLVGVGLGLCTIPGHRLGRFVLRRTPIRVHTLFLEAFMLLGGLYFLSKGWS